MLVVTLEDRDGHAYKGAEGTNGIVTIRPDGVIGTIVNDVGWLGRYLRNIFIDDSQ